MVNISFIIFITIIGFFQLSYQFEFESTTIFLSKTDCDERCGCGYTFTTKKLGFYGHDSISDVKSIYLCAKNCDDRNGCTGFRYDHEGTESYKCKTYTGWRRTIGISEEGSGWTNCLKSKIELDNFIWIRTS